MRPPHACMPAFAAFRLIVARLDNSLTPLRGVIRLNFPGISLIADFGRDENQGKHPNRVFPSPITRGSMNPTCQTDYLRALSISALAPLTGGHPPMAASFSLRQPAPSGNAGSTALRLRPAPKILSMGTPEMAGPPPYQCRVLDAPRAAPYSPLRDIDPPRHSRQATLPEASPAFFCGTRLLLLALARKLGNLVWHAVPNRHLPLERRIAR